MRNKFNYLLVILVILVLMPFVYAEGKTPSYNDVRNEWQQQIQGLVQYTPDLFTGDMSYNIPLLTIPGRSLNYPISLGYQAGIRVKQDASWVGLGWGLGTDAIIRDVRTAPDDYKNPRDSQLSDFKFSEHAPYSYRMGGGEFFIDEGSSGGPTEGKAVSTDPYNAAAGGFVELGGGGVNAGGSHFIPGDAVRDPPGYMYATSPYYKNEVDEQDLPDSYSTSFGKMILANDKNFHIYNTAGQLTSDGNDPTKIDYTLDKYGKIESFTITSLDGTRYVYDYPLHITSCDKFIDKYWPLGKEESISRFGGALKDWGYITSDISADSRSFKIYFTDNQGEGYAYEWLLTSILAPDYIDVNNNGPDDKDKGNWVRFEYEKDYQSFHEKLPYTIDTKNDLFTGEGLFEYCALPVGQGGLCPNYVETIELKCTEVAHLKKIETATHKAEFKVSERDDLAEFVPVNDYDAEKGNDHPMKLDEVILYSKDSNDRISSIKFNYDYSLDQNQPYNSNNKNSDAPEGNDGKLTLKSVVATGKGDEKLPPFTFNYVGNNPSFEGNGQNVDWSKINSPFTQGKQSNENNGLDYRYDNLGYFWEDGTKQNHYRMDGYFSGIYGAGKTSQESANQVYEKMQKADAWSLKKVNFPSGGSIEWEYEIDRARKTGPVTTSDDTTQDPDLQYKFCAIKQSSGNLGRGAGGSACYDKATFYYGGLRVKNVKVNDNNGKINQIDYYYKNVEPNELFTLSHDSSNIKDSGVASLPQSRVESQGSAPTIVGYSQVIERVKDYGYTVYKFTTPADKNLYGILDYKTPKLLDFYSQDPSYWKEKVAKYGDNSFLWGHLKSKASYDEAGKLIASSENTYSFEQQSIKTDITFTPSGSIMPVIAKSIPVWKKILKTENMVEGITTIIEYSDYNNKNGVAKMNTAYDKDNPLVKKVSQIIKFAYEVYSGIDNKHIWNAAYESQLKDSTNKIYQSSRTQYKEFNTGQWYPWKADVWKDNGDGNFNDNEYLTTSTNDYDKYGNVIKVTDAKGNSNYIEYDSRFNAYPKKGWNDVYNPVWKNEYNDDGSLKSITDQNGFTTEIKYDNFNRPSKIIKEDDNNPSVEFNYQFNSYPNWMKVKTRIDDNQYSESTEFFDGLGKATEIKSKNGPREIISKTEYNNIGKVIKSYKPYYSDESPSTLFTETIYYNEPSARIGVVNPPGGSGQIRTTYGKDADGNTVIVKDEIGHYTKSVTDVFGNLIRVYENSSDGINFGNENIYDYDIIGNLKTIKDANGNVIQNIYDTLNRLITNTHPDTGTTNNLYDDVGNLIQSTDAKGIVTKYEYDKLNRLVKKDYPHDSDVINTYDEDCLDDLKGKVYSTNKLCKVAAGSGTTRFGYDKRGRVVKQEIKISNLLLNAEKIFIITYTYNNVDNLISETINNDESTNNFNYYYDDLNRLLKIELDGSEIASYTYNPTSTIKDLIFGNSITTKYQYNERDWLKSISSQIANFGYIYDNTGNVQSLSQQNGDESKSASFVYDTLDRLTSATGSLYPQQIAFTYDAAGNRLTENDIAYQYKPSSNQMTKDVSCTYTYNAVGSTETKTCPDGMTTYLYNDENRLIKVITPLEEDEFVYDSAGQRAIKKDSTGIIIYVYDINSRNVYEETV